MEYHVCENGWDGADLQCLAYQYDWNEAIDRFVSRWPEAEPVADIIVERVYLYDSLQEALRHKGELGGEVVEVDDTGLEIKTCEFEGYSYVDGYIPANNVRRLK